MIYCFPFCFNFAFNFNLRRYNVAYMPQHYDEDAVRAMLQPYGLVQAGPAS